MAIFYCITSYWGDGVLPMDDTQGLLLCVNDCVTLGIVPHGWYLESDTGSEAQGDWEWVG